MNIERTETTATLIATPSTNIIAIEADGTMTVSFSEALRSAVETKYPEAIVGPNAAAGDAMASSLLEYAMNRSSRGGAPDAPPGAKAWPSDDEYPGEGTDMEGGGE
jgi:hypothetical protein